MFNKKLKCTKPLKADLSWSMLKGYFEPGGNSGGGPEGSASVESDFFLSDLEEFPAFPDLTIPLLGGMGLQRFSFRF